MAGQCCLHCDDQASLQSARYRRLLRVALAINCAMFVIEVLSGLRGGSVSLLADSLDFLGDAANYGISLFVLGSSLGVRARAVRIKAMSMLAFGVWVCTRNDVLGNIAVLLAAVGVFGTGDAWPDLAVAVIMSTLALTSAVHILRQSRAELRGHANGREAAAGARIRSDARHP